MQFKAAVLDRVGAPLVVRAVTAAPLGPFDVGVRIRASGLCHTDLEAIQGSVAARLPVVLGHEGAGVVEVVGTAVTAVKPGDHVVCSWNPHCGHCFYCEQDLPILCDRHIGAHRDGTIGDGPPRLSLENKPLHHFMALSTHAEYAVVTEASAIAVPKDIPFDRACLIGCGVMTGVGGAVRMARVTPGASALVVGVGAVGLNAVQGAAIARAEPIIAVDLSDHRLGLARQLGATETLNPARDDVLARVKALTHGRGADFAFEAGGGEKTLQLTIEAARPGATVIILGKTDPNQHVSLRFGSLMGEKRIIRSSYGNARPQRDFPWLARLYLEGKLKLDELIDRRLTLEEINDGFAGVKQGSLVRAVIQFS
ncbi:MAG: Zn-dependent alcohol dehydrogenase [Proteobacteria bacterium]|nr:Zn-dependent alcohol dehydrogenase [Pseudomonadota bacterium]